MNLFGDSKQFCTTDSLHVFSLSRFQFYGHDTWARNARMLMYSKLVKCSLCVSLDLTVTALEILIIVCKWHGYLVGKS